MPSSNSSYWRRHIIAISSQSLINSSTLAQQTVECLEELRSVRPATLLNRKGGFLHEPVMEQQPSYDSHLQGLTIISPSFPFAWLSSAGSSFLEMLCLVHSSSGCYSAKRRGIIRGSLMECRVLRFPKSQHSAQAALRSGCHERVNYLQKL
jgi:hypothetical protein